MGRIPVEWQNVSTVGGHSSDTKLIGGMPEEKFLWFQRREPLELIREVERGNVDTVRIVLQQNPSLNVRNAAGKSVFDIAREEGSVAMLQLLMDYKAAREAAIADPSPSQHLVPGLADIIQSFE